jgi:vacuolar protein sorting-associated protein 13A/C
MDMEVHAKYVLKNDTGLILHLELAETGLFFHNANFEEQNKDSSVIFENVGMDNRIPGNSCVIYPSGKVYLEEIDQVKDVPSLLEESLKSTSFSQTEETISQEKFITLFIPDAQKKIQLPIHRADKRYFPIYRETNQETLGIISEIKQERGSTTVTVRGIVQVFNHFTVPIMIHRFVNGEQHLVGEVLPNEFYNVPLNIIHDHVKDLHFSIKGYRTSIQSMSWKESPSHFNFVKSLQCDPINTYEPLYINAIRERFDVFFEVTSKYTMLSACFVIRLRPPLLLRNALPIDLIVSVAGCNVIKDRHNPSAEEDSSSVHKSSASGISGEDFLDFGEKLIKPGELLHLPTVKTASKIAENQIYIVARLVQYLEKDWSCKTLVPANPPEFGVWTFNSYDSVEVTSLQLGVRYIL